jgi:uncharacterized protein with HEPN domain
MSETFDKEGGLDLLQQIVEYLEMAQKSFEAVTDADFFRASHTGQEKLASICMFMMVVGEQLKKIDKLTHGNLLSKYANIAWKRIMGFRDIIAHSYGSINSKVVYRICTNEIEPLLNTVKQIISELEKTPC